MNVTEFAKNSLLPKRVLIYLQREGIIKTPLSPDNVICLQFLEQIWGKKELLRAQLSRLSLKARLSFLRTSDLPTKWERYASSRYHNLDPGKKLEMALLIEEIQTTFCFVLNKQQIRRLYTIRNRVQVARHRKKIREKKKQDALLQSTNK
jgi:hypothetical protein